jgi:hypothetical protein
MMDYRSYATRGCKFCIGIAANRNSSIRKVIGLYLYERSSIRLSNAEAQAGYTRIDHGGASTLVYTRCSAATCSHYNLNKNGKMYSLEYTDIPNVFFTQHQVGRCALMRSDVIVAS